MRKTLLSLVVAALAALAAAGAVGAQGQTATSDDVASPVVRTSDGGIEYVPGYE